MTVLANKGAGSGQKKLWPCLLSRVECTSAVSGKHQFRGQFPPHSYRNTNILTFSFLTSAP
jgi:hypothetical protein